MNATGSTTLGRTGATTKRSPSTHATVHSLPNCAGSNSTSADASHGFAHVTGNFSSDTVATGVSEISLTFTGPFVLARTVAPDSAPLIASPKRSTTTAAPRFATSTSNRPAKSSTTASSGIIRPNSFPSTSPPNATVVSPLFTSTVNTASPVVVTSGTASPNTAEASAPSFRPNPARPDNIPSAPSSIAFNSPDTAPPNSTRPV